MMDNQLTIVDVASSNEIERILKLVGPLTITTLFDFRDRVRSEKTARSVIVDMSEVPYVDSAGVGTLANGHVACCNAGRRFALAGVVDRVLTLLRVTRVDTVLKIYPTIQEARQALNAGQPCSP